MPGYQTLGLLGQGASGQVFKARQRSTGQFVAVKIPGQTSVHDPAAHRRVQQRLHQETRVLAMLQHAHVVRLLDKGLAPGGMVFAVLEFIPGETLRDFLLRNGRLPLPNVIDLMAQLLDALAFFHLHHVVHRDLKPENVMVVSTGASLHAKVLDFGLASHHGEPLFMRGGEGTPAYCAPEQLRGEPCVPATDIYAWALLFVECLNARPCVQGRNLEEVIHQQLSAAAIELPNELSGHPLASLLRKALQKDVRHRSADALSLYAELVQCLVYQYRRHPMPEASLPVSSNSAGVRGERQITLDALPVLREPPQGPHTLVMLCLGVRLVPTHHAALTLADLQELRELQMHWCANAVRDGQGRSAGVLGDCMLFHFELATDHAQNLHQAGVTALEVCKRMQRRSRLLALQHGIRIEVSGGIHLATLASDGDVSGRNHAANTALQLNSMAEPGVLLLSQAAQRAMAGRLPLALYVGTTQAQQEGADQVFQLLHDPIR